MAVSEDLKVNISIIFQYLKYLFVEKWLPTKQAKEGIAHLFRLANDVVHFFDIDLLLFCCYINPTPLTAKIAAIDD